MSCDASTDTKMDTQVNPKKDTQVNPKKDTKKETKNEATKGSPEIRTIAPTDRTKFARPAHGNGNGSVARDLLKGAVAGAIATWAMGRATTWMYDLEDERVRAREEHARNGKTAYGAAAESAAAALAGRELSGEQRERAGQALHWALGIATGAAYSVARKRWPSIARFRGLSFGTGFFLIVDETMNPMLGFTPGPLAFPWQAHARGFGGHLTYGFVNEIVLERLNR